MYNGLVEKINTVLELWVTIEYVVEYTADKVVIMPLHIADLATGFFNNCDTVILMSGTIIDVKTFAKTLGIKQYKYIEMDSEFDPEKSPIYSCTKYSLNHSNLDKFLPSIIEMSVKICESHKNDKGIIHTHNMKITNAFRMKLDKDRRFLVRDAGVTNERILEKHKIANNTVIISPSLGFGTDLKDEEGRFQIIAKTPYLPLNSKRIGILAKKDPDWYKMKTIVSLVQMAGRCTRHKDDYSSTYILDACAVDLIKRYSSMLPKYFRDRLK
jgi:Rad3-related DNA helicase